jgi:cytochrome c oxidase subunit 2
MYTAVKVLTQPDFDKWYIDTAAVIATSAAGIPMMAGETIIRSLGCIACHSADGTPMTGPSFRGAFGHEVTVITAGEERTIAVDEAYITKSILEPNTDLVKGFNANLMQTYKEQVNDKEIADIIEYIKSLK